MKRILTMLLTLTLLTSSMAALAETDEVHIDLEIREKMFLTQMTEIIINMQDYLGKTIALEGMFTTSGNPDTGAVYHIVYRTSPGCCGNDGFTGMEVVWDDVDATYPAENDWVRAVGVLESYTEDGAEYLQLRLITLDVLEERGLEFVTQ